MKKKGLIKVNAKTKEVTILASHSEDGQPILFIDDLDIAPDGKIYFSDATHFAPSADKDGYMDLLYVHPILLNQNTRPFTST